MLLERTGTLDIGTQALEFREFRPEEPDVPTIVLLHEGLGSLGLWRDFPEKLAEETGFRVFAYSRAGYGASSPVTLPRPLTYMHDEARDVLPALLEAIGFQRGLLVGHSDGASIAAISSGRRSRSAALVTCSIAALASPWLTPAFRTSVWLSTWWIPYQLASIA